MALVAPALVSRNASTRSGSAAPPLGPSPSSPSLIRWAAGHIPLHASALLPVHVAAHPDVVFVHPDATAEELTGALWLAMRGHGFRHDDAEARALILPTARRRLRTVRKNAAGGAL